MKHILFILHDAERFGSQIYLLRFLKWLKSNTDINFEILLGADGPLKHDFELLGKTHILPEQKENIGFLSHIFKKENKREIFFKYFNCKKFDLIFSNTITNGGILRSLKFNCPIICNVHEMNSYISNLSKEDLEFHKYKINKIIVCSNAVKKLLVKKYGFSSKNISVVYGFIDNLIHTSNLVGLNSKLSIPPGSFIVGSSGSEAYRKGLDLFVLLALDLLKKSNKFHFIWLSTNFNSKEYFDAQTLIKSSEFEKNFHFLTSVNNPHDYFNLFDIFVLTSREDPFPLVVLENASLCKPSICFENSGGAKEFIGNDCGYVVSKFNFKKMAEKILILFKNSKLKLKLGSNAYKKVGAYSVDIQAKKLLKIIDSYL